jgi:predicted thioesterase
MNVLSASSWTSATSRRRPSARRFIAARRWIAVEDRKVTFQIEARDQHEVIVRGLHKRAVIRTESFSRRVKEKTG